MFSQNMKNNKHMNTWNIHNMSRTYRKLDRRIRGNYNLDVYSKKIKKNKEVN